MTAATMSGWYAADPYGIYQQEQARIDRDWRVLIWYIIPQVLAIAATQVLFGQRGGQAASALLLVVAFPALIVSLLSPFVGLVILFALLPCEEMLGFLEHTFTLGKIIAIPMGLGFLYRAARGQFSILPVEGVTRAACALMLLCLFSTAWASFPLASALRGLSIVLFAVLITFGVQLIDRPHRLEIVAVAFVVGCVFVGVAMLCGFSVVNVQVDRLTLGAGNPNLAAKKLVWGAFWCLALAGAASRPSMRLAALCALPVIFVSMLLTRSRASAMALPAAVMFATLIGFKRQFARRLAMLSGLLIVFGLAFSAGMATGVIDRSKVFSRFKRLDQSWKYRSELRDVGFEMFTRSPLVGSGYGMFDFEFTLRAGRTGDLSKGLGKDPHNMWAKVAAELGIVGLAAVAWLGIAMVQAAWRTDFGFHRFVSWCLIVWTGIATMESTVIYYKIQWFALIPIAVGPRLFPRRPRGSYEPALAMPGYGQAGWAGYG